MQAPAAAQSAQPSQAPQDPSAQGADAGAGSPQMMQMIQTLGKGLGMLADMFTKMGMDDKAQAMGDIAQQFDTVVFGGNQDEAEAPSPQGGVSPMEAGANPNAKPMA